MGVVIHRQGGLLESRETQDNLVIMETAQVPQDKPLSFWGRVKIVLKWGVFIFIGLFLLAVILDWKSFRLVAGTEYAKWQVARGNARIEKMKAQDILGGKTPQETLTMYLDALEKGDYEKAVLYVVQENRTKDLDWLNSSSSIPSRLISELPECFNPKNQTYSPDMKQTSLLCGDGWLGFEQYPSGNWKIR